VKDLCVSHASDSVAFEPIAYFLADASVTARRLLGRDHKLQDPNLFWRKVETADLSEALARRFSLFVKERSLTFLEELDDWLDAHKRASRRKNKK
jgi:hypothetical protein